MEITGRHLVPAAPSRLREALADRDTVRRCLPADISLSAPDVTGPTRLEAFGRPAIVSAGPSSPDRLVLRLAPESGDVPTWSGEAEATLAEEERFTVVSWRFRPDGDAPDPDTVRRAVDVFLQRVGQFAAVPLTVAAEGASGVAASLVDTIPPARATPFGPVLARIAAWPRDLAIGGALFAVVFLIVVGIV